MKRKFITLMRVIRTGMVNFVRNAWLAIAAMAVMIITLTIVLFSVIANATFSHTIEQITDKIDVSVYLDDSVTPQQREDFMKQLKALPNAKEVTYLSKDDALKIYKEQNADNPELISAINQTDNPLPATIRVKPKDLNQIQSIKDYLNRAEVVVLQSDEPSYSGDRKEAIDKITHATNILRKAGLVAVAVFAFISVLIIFNTIQMAIFNRRDELTIMRLLGASTWYIRGPFVVEAIIYGVISAGASVLLINSLFVASSSALQASSLGLLDIQYSDQYFKSHLWELLGMQMALGVFIGAASSIIATRRYLKFKVKR